MNTHFTNVNVHLNQQSLVNMMNSPQESTLQNQNFSELRNFRDIINYSHQNIFSIAGSPSVSKPVDTPKAPPAELTFFERFLAGGIAGVTEITVMYPLDLVKTRMQLAARDGVKLGIMPAFNAVIKDTGFSGLYRGILFPWLNEAPKRAIKFSSFTSYKKMMEKDGETLSNTKITICGAMAGTTEAIAITPIETLKVRLQDSTKTHLYKNSFDAVSKILNTEGIGALFMGLEATIWRHFIWNAAYFGIAPILRANSPLPSPITESGKMANNFVVGTIAATIATALNTPPDVAKSLIQSEDYNNPNKKYRHTLQTLRLVVANEGYSGLYRGFVPKVARLGPGGGILLLVFNKLSDYFLSQR